MKYCKKHDCDYEKKCKVCNREYQRKWFAENKDVQVARVMRNTARQKNLMRDKIEEHFRNNPCVDCGESDLIVLDFDHIDEKNKYMNISMIVMKGLSVQVLLDEIAKCEVRCSNCHRRRTAKQFNTWRHQRYG
jgi:hypothetical protein